ncbi:DUF4129 domain-containing protein [Phycicoccus flavus]|uniref:DUF4129 domain-containing protein n=1 Tax=Phycicoccus flavus TaxID=2502783 RepID=UPI000FEC19F2|nr:DUF4129 domain-containing protein [Phycicoccus flavus]NHA66715.1 DUF4129 domain-containing protein [Phycicoccus flavus]
MSVLPALVRDAPLDPSSDEARRWLEQELTSPRYHEQPGLLDRFRELVERLLDSGPRTGLPSVFVPIAVGLVLAVLALVLVRVLRRDVGESGSGRGRGVLDVPDVPAATLRRQARDALDRGDWDTAVLDGLRAVARGAVERVIVDDAPGRTAHEVAVTLATPFPGEDAALIAAADAFDAVRYGERHATAEQARGVVALEERVAAARPDRPRTGASA